MRIVFSFFVLLSFLCSAWARTWTNTKGQKIEADFVKVTGDGSVVLRKGQKEYTISIATLTLADQEWLKENATVSSSKVKEKNDGENFASLLGQTLKTGHNVIPMDMTDRLELFEEVNREHVQKAEIHLFLPDGFDPSKKQKIFFTTATSSGEASQKGSIFGFGQPGIDAGWVVVTADSVKGRPPEFSMNYRLQLLDAAFDHFHDEWPSSHNWLVAGGGFSGGAKGAQTFLMNLGSKKYGDHHIVGLILAGCNECYTDRIESSREDSSRKKRRRVGVFLIQGKNDQVATIEHAKKVLEQLKEEGFKSQHYHEFEGGHTMSQEEVVAGFEWLNNHVSKMKPE